MKALQKRVNLPQLPTAVPRWGNAFTRGLGLFVFWILGWRFEGRLPDRAQLVAIGAPHTSNWDFPIAMAAIFALGLRMSWMGKHTFVDGPGKRIWHSLGGIPIDRSHAGGMTTSITTAFEERDQLWLGLMPEGTRKKVPFWKQGFIHIARNTQLPILPVALDYSRKIICIGQLIPIQMENALIFQRIAEFYKNHGIGKHLLKGNISLEAISGKK